MGEHLAKLAKLNRKQDEKPKKKMNAEERRALEKIRKEAKLNGATLQSDGEGGLPSSFCLGLFRRDSWKCKACGGKKELSLHHRGGIPESKWLSRQGHATTPANVSVICADCHNRLHSEARKAGTDSSQVTPEGDKGTYRDKGLPDAKPKA